MTPPPGLIGLALLFWGWQTGFLVVAVALATVIEIRGLVRVRWDLSRTDFNRVSDVSAVILALIAAYQIVGTDSARAVLGILQWLPLTVAPLLVCQLYSVAGVLDASIFFWSLRRRANEHPDAPRVPVDLSYPFVALTLLSASAGNVRTGVYFAGFAAFVVWALWTVRPRRYPAAAWALVVAGAIGLGWAGHVGLAEGQRALERMASAWFLDYLRRDTDPFRSSTALGDVGELKLSPRIVLRVETPPGVRPPPLLREAAYNVFTAPTWYAVDAPFRRVLPSGDGMTWRLASGTPLAGPVTVWAYLRGGRGMLAAPNGALQLDGLLALEVGTNRMGAIRVDEGLGLVRYGVRYTAGAWDDRPTRMDLLVPRHETAAVARVAEQLRLAATTPAEAVQAVRTYFRSGFGYSRFLASPPRGGSALEDFLFRTRRGHCEYYATATALLLRAAGIPTRYAVGYAVHEWSALERRWVVRANDAHAWVMVWLDGAWRELDTTPAEWVDAERDALSSFGALGDLWSWAGYVFSRWRWSEREDRLPGGVAWLVIPLAALLGWRLYSRRRVRSGGAATRDARRAPRAGADSEFYQVERALARLAFPRADAESLSAWLARVDAAPPPAVDTRPLRGLLALHYRYRFDPDGLAPAERAALSAESRAWLAEHAAIGRR
ncbi:MAG TPA: transglutaminase-like domain-containing protein [Methylomirabilota bacterium]|nr:transglutaminase-like domain-containing protein [Methylomirabilota bacterium]